MAGSCFDYCSRKVTRPGTIGIRKVVRDEGTFENLRVTNSYTANDCREPEVGLKIVRVNVR